MTNGRSRAIPGRWRLRVDRAGSPPDPRFSLANERTFLAWNRTALALIGGGLAAAQLLRVEVGGARLMVGLPLIGLGAAVGLAGITRWRACELAMRRRARLPRPRLAVALLGIGASAIAVLSIVLLTLSQLRS
jgi:inner membrane protein YidH